MLIAGDLGSVNYQFIGVIFSLPSGIETWVRQSQEPLVASPHEVHERFLSRSDTPATGTPMFPKSDVGTQAIDQNESRVQGDHFGQLVLAKSLSP